MLYCMPAVACGIMMRLLKDWCQAQRAIYCMFQVVPIYGRGGAQEDPRGKHKASQRMQHQESHEAVPRRPAGQRHTPTNVSSADALLLFHTLLGVQPADLTLMQMQRGSAAQHSGNVNLQPGLGIIPMLFGLNNNSGMQSLLQHGCACCLLAQLIDAHAGNGGYSEPLTPEQQHQVCAFYVHAHHSCSA